MNKKKPAKNKALHEISAKHILGHNATLTLKGPSSVVHSTANVINASHDLYSALCYEGTSIEKIRGLLERKRAAAKIFYETTGTKWLL